MEEQSAYDTVVRVLVVDDEPSIRLLMARFLAAAGYEVDTAKDAPTGKEMLGAFNYDVIVSDIVMPGQSGVNLLAEIRRIAPAVQVILMTGEPTVSTAAEAVRTGASDYLSKPITREAILRSVAHAARIKRLDDERRRLERENEAYRNELEARNEQLDALVREKSRQLAEAHDRLALADRTKNEFLKLIAHELRTPVNGTLGIAEMVFDRCQDDPGMRELLDLFASSRDRLLDTLEGALLLAQIQTSRDDFRPSRVNLSDVLADAHSEVVRLARDRGVTFDALPVCSAVVLGEPELFRKALATLLETAVVFSESGQSVSVQGVEGADTITLAVAGRGKSLAPELAANFFKVFGTVRQLTPAEELGLKPAVAECVFSLFGGRVQIEGVTPPGVQLTLSLPKPDARM